MTLICGVLSPSAPHLADRDVIDSMLKAAGQRGRDGTATFVDSAEGVALACAYTATFLPAGRAPSLPWQEDDGLVAGVAGSLRSACGAGPGAPARNPDVATLLDAYLREPAAFADNLDGDFTLFLWDRRTRNLHLAGDSFARRPLYYHYEPRTRLLVFASELKSVLAHPAVAREVDRRALSLYLGLGFVPSPYSLVSNVRKIQPAEAILVSPSTMTSRRYWRPRPDKAPGGGVYRREDAEERLTVATRNISNGAAKIGVFLSGGIDSSVALAALKQVDEADLTALTLIYEGSANAYDLPWAKRVAEALGCRHQVVFVNAEHQVTPALLSRLLRQVDEPFDSEGRIVSEHFLWQKALELGINSCLTGSGAGLVFSRRRWQRLLDAEGRARSFEETVAFFIDELSFFDHGQQQDMLPWQLETEVFAEAARTNLDMLEGLDPYQAMVLLRVLRAPQGRLGLFSVAIPPLFGAEERTAYLDRELVEYGLAIAADKASANKEVLKEAFNSVIQVDFDQRERRAYPSAPLPSWLEQSMPGHLDILAADGLIDSGYLHNLDKKYRQGRKSARKDAWQLFVLACWYEFHIKQRDPL